MMSPPITVNTPNMIAAIHTTRRLPASAHAHSAGWPRRGRPTRRSRAGSGERRREHRHGPVAGAITREHICEASGAMSFDRLRRLQTRQRARCQRRVSCPRSRQPLVRHPRPRSRGVLRVGVPQLDDQERDLLRGGRARRAGHRAHGRLRARRPAVTAINGGPHFTFDEAVSFLITCADQDEIDYYWNSLTDCGEE